MNAPDSQATWLTDAPRREVPDALIDALKSRFGPNCSTALAVREQHGRDESARAAFTHKELGVVVDTDVPVGQPTPCAQADGALCHSLFANLIKNACEAAPARSKVLITLKDETPLCVTIENKGTVPLEIRPTFFDKFVTHGKDGGSGLGTYSARMLATAQGGKIKMATNDQANTTTLTVWLPRQPD